MSTPQPKQVREGRDRLLAGQRLPEGGLQLRPYYCRTCGAEQNAVIIPRGWYTLARSTGTYESKPVRLGLYCSIRCLMAQEDRLVGIEDDLGDRFDSAPSEFRQRRTW